MNILVTGCDGFIGKNLIFHLKSNNSYNIIKLKKKYSINELKKKVLTSDAIFHLAGVNKGNSRSYFLNNNYFLTKKICTILKNAEKKIKIIFSSSIHVKKNNYYGLSKLKSEKELLKLKKIKNISILIYRLPNVFGKWSKPFYNSVVATYCYQISRKKKISIHSNQELKLLYIDDLVKDFLKVLKINNFNKTYRLIKKISKIKLKKLAFTIKSFSNETSLTANNNLNDLVKKLYSTYLSFIPKKLVSYNIIKSEDHRGKFVEFLKFGKYGQISYFTILPGKFRGNHYHHTKTEKFLVVSGSVKFIFINVVTKRKYSIIVSEMKEKVIITQPGWAHNIMNIGTKTAKIIVWSNEVYNKKYPDTINHKF